MAGMNAGLILQGQGIDPVNALARGAQGAATVNAVRDQNAMRDMFKANGAGIMAGDQNALNAFAQLDPNAALGVQNTHLGMDKTRQSMAHANERQAMLSREEKRNIEAHAANMSAEQRAAEAAKLKGILNGAAHFHSTGDQQGYNDYLARNEIDPMNPEYTFNNFPATAARYGEVLETLETFQDMNAEPAKGEELPAAVRALQFRAEQAGLQPGTAEYMQFMADGGRKNDQMVIESDGRGGFTMRQGAGVADDGRMSPSSPQAMIDSIEATLSDPALDTATGILSPLQNIPGTPQYRFGTRADQLSGQAFLQAFESLKGAGQITEIEGQKATQAIGRLDTAQSAADYREALGELKAVLEAAQGRAGQPSPPAVQPQTAPAMPNAGDTVDGYRFKGGDPSQQSNWERM